MNVITKTALFCFALATTVSPEFKPGSGRDTAGLAVPEANTANFAGNWTYDPGPGRYARGQLIDLLQRLGASVTTLDAHGYRIRCTWDGRTLSCLVRR